MQLQTLLPLLLRGCDCCCSCCCCFQVRALCQNPNGGIPASFLSSQQSEGEAVAVKKELSKVRFLGGVTNMKTCPPQP
jgi:hypothetical protein